MAASTTLFQTASETELGKLLKALPKVKHDKAPERIQIVLGALLQPEIFLNGNSRYANFLRVKFSPLFVTDSEHGLTPDQREQVNVFSQSYLKLFHYMQAEVAANPKAIEEGQPLYLELKTFTADLTAVRANTGLISLEDQNLLTKLEQDMSIHKNTVETAIAMPPKAVMFGKSSLELLHHTYLANLTTLEQVTSLQQRHNALKPQLAEEQQLKFSQGKQIFVLRSNLLSIKYETLKGLLMVQINPAYGVKVGEGDFIIEAIEAAEVELRLLFKDVEFLKEPNIVNYLWSQLIAIRSLLYHVDLKVALGNAQIDITGASQRSDPAPGVDLTLGGRILVEDFQTIQLAHFKNSYDIRTLMTQKLNAASDNLIFFLSLANFEVVADILAENRRNTGASYGDVRFEKHLCRLMVFPYVMNVDINKRSELVHRLSFIVYGLNTMIELGAYLKTRPHIFRNILARRVFELTLEQVLIALLTEWPALSSDILPFNETKAQYYEALVTHQTQLIIYNLLISLHHIDKYRLITEDLLELIMKIATKEEYARFAVGDSTDELLNIVIGNLQITDKYLVDAGLKMIAAPKRQPPQVNPLEAEKHCANLVAELEREDQQLNQELVKEFDKRKKRERAKAKVASPAKACLFQPELKRLEQVASPQALKHKEAAQFLSERQFEAAAKAYEACRAQALQLGDHKFVAASLLGLSECQKLQALAATPTNFNHSTADKNFEKMYGHYLEAQALVEEALLYFYQQIAPSLDEIPSEEDDELEQLCFCLHLCMTNADNYLKFTIQKNDARVEHAERKYRTLVAERNEALARIGIDAWRAAVNPSHHFAELRAQAKAEKINLAKCSAKLTKVSQEGLAPLSLKFACLAGKSSLYLPSVEAQLLLQEGGGSTLRSRLKAMAQETYLLKAAEPLRLKA